MKRDGHKFIEQDGNHGGISSGAGATEEYRDIQSHGAGLGDRFLNIEPAWM